MIPTRPLRHTVLIGTCAGALALAGCGSSDDGMPAAAPSAPRGDAAPSGQDGREPGVSGTVAAIDEQTLQVQGNGEQTAVVYTSETTMTAQVEASASDLAVGDCVSVRTAADGSTNPADANSGSAALAADSVTILSGDGCDDVSPGGGGGVPGGGVPGDGTRPSRMPSGAPSDLPSGMPSDVPSGMPSGGPPSGRGFGGFGAFGEVTAMSSGSFTLTQTLPGGPGWPGAATPSAGPTASASSTPTTVSHDGDTTFLATETVEPSAITVGSCVRATGSTDDTGTLSATTLALSQPADGSCMPGVRGG